MSEDEKQAIEYFKNINHLYNFSNLDLQYTESEFENSNVLLNLIEKQQKEIEELNEALSLHEQTSFDLQQENIRLQEEKDLLSKMNKKLIDESISKNKVKEKIKEYDDIFSNASEEKQIEFYEIQENIIYVLKSLLESE